MQSVQKFPTKTRTDLSKLKITQTQIIHENIGKEKKPKFILVFYVIWEINSYDINIPIRNIYEWNSAL